MNICVSFSVKKLRKYFLEIQSLSLSLRVAKMKILSSSTILIFVFCLCCCLIAIVQGDNSAEKSEFKSCIEAQKHCSQNITCKNLFKKVKKKCKVSKGRLIKQYYCKYRRD